MHAQLPGTVVVRVQPATERFALDTGSGWLVLSDGLKVLRSADKWYGVTYREDKPVVVKAIADMTAQGLYPDNLWGV